ncbi:hypothetical protein [Symbiopectobacterium sp. RP]|uniref:hypothetical protein n=1 Tax=Symbiopectobacterium sp. RP TaxID=3248553 RepID=UPI003D2BC235
MFSIPGSHKSLSVLVATNTLNPIEHKWAQKKSKKRESGCDTEILFSVHMV